MKQLNNLKHNLCVKGPAVAVALLGGAFFQTLIAQTPSPSFDAAKVQKGLAIAPVKLNLQGKDANLVGYGSYLVNAASDCNGCHTSAPAVEYASGGNPYLGQHPTVVNPANYLGGGRDFGAFPDPTGPFPHIKARNLTPDATGLPEGGTTYDQFVQIMRTGMDMDKVHPTCKGAPDGNCLPPPFNGDLLQIMPWPAYQNMTDDDLLAIYTYLSAVPCVEGGPGEPANRCEVATPKTMTIAVAGPKDVTVVAPQIVLDGSKSKSANGQPLKYQWTIPQGSPAAAITGADTATPSVQFTQRFAAYKFLLTVTDSAGNTSTDVATVNYQGN